jgi:DNA-binding NtrC family response regulator/CHASE2 domain-containing sensor protein
MNIKDRKKIASVAGIIFIVSLLYIIPFPWNRVIDNAAANLHMQLRGERDSSSEVVLIYIGEEDIQSLGGWPITRDYYSYLLHILNQKGVKTIGFDLLFDTSSQTYPEYDSTLAHFISQQGNVILPYVFNNVSQKSNELPEAKDAIYPTDIFKQSAHCIGYSNLGEFAAVPLLAAFNDTLSGSLGFEMARHFLDLSGKKVEVQSNDIIIGDENGESGRFPLNLFLNYLGGVERFPAYSFIEVLQLYQQNPDSLNLSGKLVFIAVISPGRCSLRPTVLATALPASLIHLTVAENLIENHFLRHSPRYIGVLLILFLGSILLFIPTGKSLLIESAVVIPLYFSFTYSVFIGFDLILPLFFPIVAQLAIGFVLGLSYWRGSQVRSDSQRILMQNQLEIKQKQYEELEEKLDSLESILDREKDTAIRNEALVNEIRELEKQIRDLQEYTTTKKPLSLREFPEIIHTPGSSMAHVLELAVKVSSDNIPVFILGETGTGKEVIARAIHFSGQRRQNPFVAVNCGALPETLLESELFGHEKGSFTGASALRRGRFESAHKGTLFLDEVTETSAAFQVKLLRVLQEGTFERLGGEKTIRVDARVIAASSRDITDELKNGRFREDLFYRLNGFPVQLPPLRERKDDIPLLVQFFLKKHGYHRVKGFSEEAMLMLYHYSWPGNIRELENSVRRCAILTQSDGRNLVQAVDLPQELKREEETALPYQSLEQQILELLRSLKFSHAAISKTAKILGNRDRGTITEYFRGTCFEYFVNNAFNLPEAVKKIAASDESEVLKRVDAKVREYIKNIFQACHTAEPAGLFKGLPKKYHSYLEQIIEYCRNVDGDTARRLFEDAG